MQPTLSLHWIMKCRSVPAMRSWMRRILLRCSPILSKISFSASKIFTRFPTNGKSKKFRTNFYVSSRTKDLQQLARFHRQLDIIARGLSCTVRIILGVTHAGFFTNKQKRYAEKRSGTAWTLSTLPVMPTSTILLLVPRSSAGCWRSRGYGVGIIAQPDWRKKESIQVFGEPRLGFLVTAGNMDSMVNHYTVSRRTPVRKMHIHREDRWGSDRTCQRVVCSNTYPPDLQTYTDHSRWHRGKSSASGTL